jgi:N-glycosylase/DNA lyase
MNQIRQVHSAIRDQIEARLSAFDRIWKTGTDEDIFYEMVFCILTPQSRPEMCWEAVRRLRGANLVSMRDSKTVLEHLYGVRFKYKKSEFVLEAKQRFFGGGKSIRETLSSFSEIKEARDWLAVSVKGIGVKEAGHFLRNIGLGGELAILDRHVLRYLKEEGVIESIPSSLTLARYKEIENKMTVHARGLGISMSHLDFVLFYRATGLIFK